MRSNHKARLERLISRHPDAVFTDGALHRRDQLLVTEHQSEHAREAGADFVDRVDEYPEIGVHRLWLRASARVDVPEFAADLREQGISATPNHLLRGEPSYMRRPVRRADARARRSRLRSRTAWAAQVTVAVLDTGITPHPWFTNTDWWPAVTPEQLDPVAAGCDYELDAQSGHGTFVAGVILQKAPNARLWIDRLLDDIGICDELELLHSLGRVRRREQLSGIKVDVVNISLGGYAHADHPSPLVADSLRKFGSHTVIVTAAGNNGSDRPFWPAALKDCVAVASQGRGVLRPRLVGGRERPGRRRRGPVPAAQPGRRDRARLRPMERHVLRRPVRRRCDRAPGERQGHHRQGGRRGPARHGPPEDRPRVRGGDRIAEGMTRRVICARVPRARHGVGRVGA